MVVLREWPSKYHELHNATNKEELLTFMNHWLETKLKILIEHSRNTPLQNWNIDLYFLRFIYNTPRAPCVTNIYSFNHDLYNWIYLFIKDRNQSNSIWNNDDRENSSPNKSELQKCNVLLSHIFFTCKDNRTFASLIDDVNQSLRTWLFNVFTSPGSSTEYLVNTNKYYSTLECILYLTMK